MFANIERHLCLHTSLTCYYVVDGYRVELEFDDHRPSIEVQAETVHEALVALDALLTDVPSHHGY